MKITIQSTIFLLLLISCQISNNTTEVSSKKSEQNKDNVLVGVVKYIAPITSSKQTVKTDQKEYYFVVQNEYFFVKFSDGYVTETELSKYTDKEIAIKGQIKSGSYSDEKPGSFSDGTTPVSARNGKYVSIDKIYKKK